MMLKILETSFEVLWILDMKKEVFPNQMKIIIISSVMKLMMKVFLCPEQSSNNKTEWIELNRYCRKLNIKLLWIDNKVVVFFL